MARRTQEVPIEAEGRDKDKLFVITEMPSSQGEAWAIRVLLALLAANVELPKNADVDNLSMATLAQMGFQALGQLQWFVVKPLLDELMACVKIVPGGIKQTLRVPRELIEDSSGDTEEDIQEIETRFMLRYEVFKLHTGFLKAASGLLKNVPGVGKQVSL